MKDQVPVSSDLEFIRPEFAFEREFGQFRNWWARDKRIVGNAMSILMYLVSHNHTYRITQQRARQDLGLGRDAFRAGRDKLEVAGFLEAVERRYPAGTTDTNGRPVGGHRYVVYRLLDPQEPAEIDHSLVQEALTDNPRRFETGESAPVDNSATAPSTEIPATENPEPGNPSLKEDQVKEDQSSSSTREELRSLSDVTAAEASPAPMDDDESSSSRFVVVPALANLLREVHPRLDAELLVRRLSRRMRVDTLDLERAAVEIVTASTRAIGDPVAYVASSIEKEPGRWVRPELLPPDTHHAPGVPFRTDAHERADVRSARARGLVPKDWPETLQLDADARAALDAARAADRAHSHDTTDRKDVHA